MSDEYLTPSYAVKPILKYLKPNSKIWCPFDKEDSEFVKLLKDAGHIVIYTHIDNGKDQDFFNWSKDLYLDKINNYDYIISNPPFSLKNEIIERLIDIRTPFAMLMPINILEGIKRFKQFKRTNIELLLFDKRICFNNNSKSPVATMYLCSNILPEKLILETLEKKEM